MSLCSTSGLGTTTSLKLKSLGFSDTLLSPSSFRPLQDKRANTHAVLCAYLACMICMPIRFIWCIRRFNGSSENPRLSVFCSDKQLYAMLVDDQKKKCLFYGSTLQASIRGNPPCTTTEAAERVGEEFVKACIKLDINEISSYDRNGFARGERMQAFEIAISRHGFLYR
ncbi:Ribosomal protein L18 [Dillenia turbinata]|uniref:Ribosomal protein L18 n=1 Tax=Dillenia turbinata TaxID=194707 RepID=A0AAN8VP39_9MAGN